MKSSISTMARQHRLGPNYIYSIITFLMIFFSLSLSVSILFDTFYTWTLFFFVFSIISSCFEFIWFTFALTPWIHSITSYKASSIYWSFFAKAYLACCYSTFESANWSSLPSFIWWIWKFCYSMSERTVKISVNVRFALMSVSVRIFVGLM